MSSVPARVTGLGGPEFPGLLPAALIGETPDGRLVRRTTRDWAVDVVCFVMAASFGLLLFFLQSDVKTAPDLLLLADLGFGVLLCLTLWWRRHWPVQLMILGAVVTSFSAFGAVASSFLLFTVAVHRKVSVVLGAAVLSLVAGVVFIWIRPDPSLPFWVSALINVPIVASVTAWGMFVRARRQLVISLLDRTRRAESEQQLRIEQVRHLERVRIAREMHDVLAHRISLVSLHAGALEFRADAEPAEVAKSAAVIRFSAHQALQDLREILGVLRAEGPVGEPEAAERPQPTLTDVVRLVEESRNAGMRVSVDCPQDDLLAVPPSTGRTAYRIVQEGLTNAHKHAPGAVTSVTVSGQPGAGLVVEVRNRCPAGRPAHPVIPGAGQGIVGLIERAAIAGGSLEHGWLPSGDFRLLAWLPWSP